MPVPRVASWQRHRGVGSGSSATSRRVVGRSGSIVGGLSGSLDHRLGTRGAQPGEEVVDRGVGGFVDRSSRRRCRTVRQPAQPCEHRRARRDSSGLARSAPSPARGLSTSSTTVARRPARRSPPRLRPCRRVRAPASTASSRRPARLVGLASTVPLRLGSSAGSAAGGSMAGTISGTGPVVGARLTYSRARPAG